MVKITNHTPLSQVFSVREGDKVTSKSLLPDATDDFDLVEPNGPIVAGLVRSGQITIDNGQAPQPAAPSPAWPVPSAPADPHEPGSA